MSAGPEESRETVRVASVGPLRWIELDRPEVRNALNVETVRALAECIIEASTDTAVRAIAITGVGGYFCAGGDLRQLSSLAEQGAQAVVETIYSAFHGLIEAIDRCSTPLVAVINGPAIGAGLDLAMACDFRVMAEDAFLESAWIKAGLLPGMGGTHLLARAVGVARATEICLLGRRIAADTASAWGLVNAVVPQERLQSEAAVIADTLSMLSSAAIGATRASVRRFPHHGIESELKVLGASQANLMTAPTFTAFAAPFRAEAERHESSRSGP